MRITILLPVVLFAITGFAQNKLPIIDMHLHALPAALNGPPPTAICAPPEEMPVHDPAKSWAEGFNQYLKNPKCENAVWGPVTDKEVMDNTLEILEKNNIYGVTSGSLIDDYMSVGGDRIIPALHFNFFMTDKTPEKVREFLSSGKYKVFAEVAIQYNGVSPSDLRFDPYAKIAEELDIPIGIHLGTGPPGAAYLPGVGNYRAKLHSPLVVEELLMRHPKLRIYLMHAGYPMIDDLLAVLWTHPQVYVDVGVICFAIPRKAFHEYLRRIFDAGFGKRVMFGSDQMNWPKTIEVGLEAINTADFLDIQQKRDILYNNAAKFLRLSDEEIAIHHGKKTD
ncbi:MULTISPECIES: amidohydrolase family protein [Arenibacter]|uniref:amidohydrolase family protein n=1 Tax=Arenibacter TaxID=178469 RepID=UPI00068C6D91|nr:MULTISPECIES: amidohydrolase family protein [Arenibacter]GBF18199.1 amidohydrolase [Arenibacter sp. NBRC 103722]